MNTFLTLLGIVSTTAYAEDVHPTTKYCKIIHPGCGAGSDFLIQFAVRVVDMISVAIGGVAVILVIWGAIRVIASAGNDEGKTQGRTIIIGAVAGLALAIMGKAFVLFTCEFVSGVVGSGICTAA